MLAIVGESGSGKSVMALAIMRLLSTSARVDQGSILFSFDGREAVDLLRLNEKDFRSYRGSRISMIFQEPMTSMNPMMTCGAQVLEPLMLHKKIKVIPGRQAVLELFRKVQLPDPEQIYRRYPHQLSGGQKQRVMIAMAISCDPAVLICDEPTTALDVRIQKTILDLLRDLRHSENIGMILITHDLGLVADMADRAMVMLKGRLMEYGPVKSLFTLPKHPYTRGLLYCRPALHPKGERLPLVSDFLNGNNQTSLSEFSGPVIPSIKEQVFISFSGKETRKPVVKESDILIRVKNLGFRYSTLKTWLGKRKNGVDAIRNISFDVYNGETLGLVGESGCGKTTLGRALLGLNNPYRGSVSYNGVELHSMVKAELLDFRRNIQMVFQDPYSSLNPRMMIGPAIEEPLKVHGTMTRSERKERVVEWLGKVDLKPEHFNRYPYAFSGGQRQRIVIARALALEPGFVVFDESVSALDVSVQAQVLNLINDLKEKLGFTVVFISHDLSVVRWLCDRVIVMEKGEIVETGDTEDVYLNPKTSYTRSLIEAIPGYNLMEKY